MVDLAHFSFSLSVSKGQIQNSNLELSDPKVPGMPNQMTRAMVFVEEDSRKTETIWERKPQPLTSAVQRESSYLGTLGCTRGEKGDNSEHTEMLNPPWREKNQDVKKRH